MPENQRMCSYCHQYKPWTWNGKRLRDGSKIFLDEKENRWSGKRCPECERRRVRVALKCTTFERKLIFDELLKQGFEILSASFPLKVAKDGKDFSVAIRYATTQAGQVVLEDDGQQLQTDMYALLFYSVRVVTQSSLKRFEEPKPTLNLPDNGVSCGA